MAQKIIGYREMAWTCPNCGAKNNGSVRVCKSCGASMSQETKFEQKSDAALIKDDKIIEKAKRGPDVYCVYCGNRNPAGSAKCERCGADLSEGEKRQSGQQYTVQKDSSSSAENTSTADDTASDNTVNCSVCGTANPKGAMKCSSCGSPLEGSTVIPTARPQADTQPAKKKGCSKGCLIIALIMFVIGAIAIFGMFSVNDSDNTGYTISENNTNNGQVFDFGSYDTNNGSSSGKDSVQNVDNQSFGSGSNTSQSNSRTARVTNMNWNTAVKVMGYIDSHDSDWYSDLPSDASDVDCEDRLKYTSDDEVAGAKEVCGEPYSIDLGNGYEQMVQDCQYEVYEKYCDYTTQSWGVVDTRRASGSGNNPSMPFIDTSKGYEAGDQSASFVVTLQDETGKTYELEPSSLSEYRSYSVGDEYMIELNNRGRITGMERK